MIQFDEFKQSLLGMKPELENLHTALDLEEGAAETAFARAAQQTILLTESAKGRRSSLYQFMEYADVQMLITDTANALTGELKAALQRACVEVRFIEVGNA